jgi:hypothetical protein
MRIMLQIDGSQFSLSCALYRRPERTSRILAIVRLNPQATLDECLGLPATPDILGILGWDHLR